MTPENDQNATGTAEVGSDLPASAHLEAMTTRKPTLPPHSHIAIATAVATVVADAPAADVDSLPAKVRETLDYFEEVASVGRAIATEQAAALKEYRDDTALLLAESATDLDVDDAAALVDTLFSSHLMARLLADVAAGNIEPVATVTKTTKTAPKAEPKAGEKQQAKTAKKTAAAAREQDGETPAAPSAPAADPQADEPDESDDFVTEPVVEPVTEPVTEPVLPPDPEESSARAAAPRRSAPPAGVRPLAVDDDDF